MKAEHKTTVVLTQDQVQKILVSHVAKAMGKPIDEFKVQLNCTTYFCDQRDVSGTPKFKDATVTFTVEGEI